MKAIKSNSTFRVVNNKVAAVEVPATAANVTAEDVQNYLRIRERRIEMQRQVDALAAVESKFGSVIQEFTEKRVARNQSKSTKLGAFILSLVPGGRYPSWKQEFIRLAGEEAAEQVIESTPPKIKLEVTTL